jgi:hypothetical protein
VAETKKVDGAIVPTGVVTYTCWLLDDLGEGFMVAYRLVPKNGSPVIAETRVYPGTVASSTTPGTWSGKAASVPQWGLTARLLHKLHPDTSLRSVPDIAGNMKRWMGEDIFGKQSVMTRHGFSTAKPARRLGRPPIHDELFYALLAREYDRLVNKKGSQEPIMQLVKARKAARPTVDGWIQRVRNNYGFLTSAPPGRPGGHLTPEAKAVLRAAGEEEE